MTPDEIDKIQNKQIEKLWDAVIKLKENMAVMLNENKQIKYILLVIGGGILGHDLSQYLIYSRKHLYKMFIGCHTHV